MSKSSKTSDFLLTIIARFGGKAANLVVFAIVANKLSLADMGVYGYIFTTTLIFSTILDLGVRNSIAVSIGKEPTSSSDYTRSAYLLLLPIAVLCLPLTVLYLRFGPENTSVAAATIPAALLLAFMLHQRMLQGASLGHGDIETFNRTELASRIILVALTLLMLATNQFSLSTAIWALAISQAFGSLYLAVKQAPKYLGPGASARFSIIVRLVRAGIPFMVAVVLMQASKKLAFYTVSYESTLTEGGIFFGLQRLTEVVTEVGLAISVVLLSHNVRATSKEEAAANTAKSVRVSIAVFVAISVAMVALSWILVPTVLGKSFEGHSLLFSILVVGTLFAAIWTMLFPSLSVATSPTTVLKILSLGLALNVIATFGMTWAWGLLGAASSTIVVNIIISAMFLRTYKIRFGIGASDFIFAKRDDLPIDRLRKKLLPSKNRSGE